MDRWVDEMDDGSSSVIRIPWFGMTAFFLVSRGKALPARLGSAMERSVGTLRRGCMDAWMHGDGESGGLVKMLLRRRSQFLQSTSEPASQPSSVVGHDHESASQSVSGLSGNQLILE